MPILFLESLCIHVEDPRGRDPHEPLKTVWAHEDLYLLQLGGVQFVSTVKGQQACNSPIIHYKQEKDQ